MSGEASERPAWRWSAWSLIALMGIGTVLMLWLLIARQVRFVGPVPTTAFNMIPMIVFLWLPSQNHLFRLLPRLIFTMVQLLCLAVIVMTHHMESP